MTDTNDKPKDENIQDPAFSDDTSGLSDGVEQIADDFSRIPGIPKEIVEEWKQKYKTVFRIWFLNEQYIYRNFTYYEYRELQKKIRVEYKDNVEAGDESFREEIQKICLLWPKDYQQRLETGKPVPIPGGIPFMLGDYILAASGFTDNLVPDIISNES